MQSHLSTDWPPISTYKAALSSFAATGAEIHVTELDITLESNAGEAKQAELYESVFTALKEAKETGVNITSVSVWGVIDDWSWRNAKSPLLFKSTSFTKKPAYNSVAALIPSQNHGDGTNPQFNTPNPGEVTADAYGYFFHHTFENGATHSWSRRGNNVTATNSTAQKNSGSAALFVQGRNDTWNGALFSLPDREFKAGDERSFSVMVRHEGSGTKTVSLSLQYDNPAGTESYANIGSADAAGNTWVQISNPAYELPAGSNFAIYVEMDDASANFYVDDAMGGVKGATINPDGTPVPVSVNKRKNAVRGHTPLVTVRGRTLNVNSSTDSKIKIRLVNMMGKTVANFNAAGNAKLSLKKIPAGVYVVEARRIKDGYRTTSAITLR
jgi:hypothetical protein